MNAKTIAKMSDTVLACEDRAAWRDVESALRHDMQPSATVSNRAAALRAEMMRRGVTPLPM